MASASYRTPPMLLHLGTAKVHSLCIQMKTRGSAHFLVNLFGIHIYLVQHSRLVCELLRDIFGFHQATQTATGHVCRRLLVRSWLSADQGNSWEPASDPTHSEKTNKQQNSEVVDGLLPPRPRVQNRWGQKQCFWDLHYKRERINHSFLQFSLQYKSKLLVISKLLHLSKHPAKFPGWEIRRSQMSADELAVGSWFPSTPISPAMDQKLTPSWSIISWNLASDGWK